MEFAVSVGVAAGVLTGYLLGKRLDRVVFGERWKEVPVSHLLWETRLGGVSASIPDGQPMFAVSYSH